MTDEGFRRAGRVARGARATLRAVRAVRARRTVKPPLVAYALVVAVGAVAGRALERRPRRYRHRRGHHAPRWTLALPAGGLAGLWLASMATLAIPGRPTSLRDDLVASLWPVEPELRWHGGLRTAAMSPYGVAGWVGDVSVSGMGSGQDGVTTLQLSFSRRGGSFADDVAGNGGGSSVDVETVALDGPPGDESAERPPAWEVRQAAAQLAGMTGENDGPADAIWADRSAKARVYARLPWDTIDLPCDGEDVTFWLLRPPPEEDTGDHEVWVAYGVIGALGVRLAGWGVAPGEVELARIADLGPILERDRERRAEFLD